MKRMKSISASYLSRRVVIGAVLLTASLLEVLPVVAQEYGGNLTPPPPRPRRAYSTIDTYNYTHGGGDTTYSDPYKKARRVKKIRKAIKAKVNDIAPKVTTIPGATGRSKKDEESASSTKSDSDTSTETPKSVKSEASKTKSDSHASDVSKDTDTTETSKTPSLKAKDSETASESTDSDESKNTTATEDGSNGKETVNDSGAKLSSIPPPQMPPPPTSKGGFTMRTSLTK